MNSTPVTLRVIWGSVVESAFRLAAGLRDNSLTAEDFDEFRRRLQRTPLPTLEFHTACQRIGNVQRYLLAHEFGAAEFELRMLTRTFQRYLQQEAAAQRATTRVSSVVQIE